MVMSNLFHGLTCDSGLDVVAHTHPFERKKDAFSCAFTNASTDACYFDIKLFPDYANCIILLCKSLTKSSDSSV